MKAPKPKNPRYSDEYLLECLRKYARENGKAPGKRTFENSIHGRPQHTTYIVRFGSWNNAIRMAGLTPNVRWIPNDTGVPATIRFRILKRDNFTCQYCGGTPKLGFVLHVDHKDGDRDNNSEENLITGCWFCNVGKGDIPL